MTTLVLSGNLYHVMTKLLDNIDETYTCDDVQQKITDFLQLESRTSSEDDDESENANILGNDNHYTIDYKYKHIVCAQLITSIISCLSKQEGDKKIEQIFCKDIQWSDHFPELTKFYEIIDMMSSQYEHNIIFNLLKKINKNF